VLHPVVKKRGTGSLIPEKMKPLYPPNRLTCKDAFEVSPVCAFHSVRKVFRSPFFKFDSGNAVAHFKEEASSESLKKTV
jgi:hypothetical protein